MDVDLLRPGTVPMSPDTVLWFEFLLDKDLLLKHLQKPAPDPSPTELINKFTTAIFECAKNYVKRELENGEFVYNIDISHEQNLNSRKMVALKILALKVAAYIKWNLNILRTLPPKVQINLLQDLLYFTRNNTYYEIPNIPDFNNIESFSDSFLFALTLYYRWLLICCVHGFENYNSTRNIINNEVGLIDENLIFSQENMKKCEDFLNNILKSDKIPNMITFTCFPALTESSSNIEFKWSQSISISKEEFLSQIHYELAIYYFYREDYNQAKIHFTNSMENYKNTYNNVGFLTISLPVLESYIVACDPQSNMKNTLLHHLRISVATQFTGLLNILLQDNIKREIPVVHIVNIELDILGAISSGKFTVARDLLPKVQVLNVLRIVLEEIFVELTEVQINADAFVWALLSLWTYYSDKDKQLIISFILELIAEDKVNDLLPKINTHSALHEIIKNPEVNYLLKIKADLIEIPQLLIDGQWDVDIIGKKRNPMLELRSLEQQVISSYNPRELRDLLVKLSAKDSSRPVWKINSHWVLPIPLQSVIMSISRGFLQDYGYILLAKSKELMLLKDWKAAIDLLYVLENEIQSNATSATNKLSKLISWEILLIKINQLLEEWPALNIDKQELITACETCVKGGDIVLPRTEIMEQSMVCLLNLNDWDVINCVEKRWGNFEIAIAIMSACQDLSKSKGNKKVLKDLWDLVLPIFSIHQNKRSNTGNSNSPLNSDKIVTLSVFSRLRDHSALSVIISMLTKYYNILRDEASLELNFDNLMLWPAVISNANSYSVIAAFEVLSQLVQQGLKYYPTNCSWLRLSGDINFANLSYEKALCFYLKYLLIASDYFNIPVRSDDVLFKKMIKCCIVLGCHTQVAVLTQFLDEPDYMLAFRSLSEQKCNDAIDAYYHCIWDSNILEYLIHIHHKKTEFQRRKRAVCSMGLLELNANNNEEIQRESSNLRKKAFLRAMCKQYIPQ